MHYVLSVAYVVSLQASHHGGRGPRHPAGVAADGSGRRARHAAHRSGAALHAAAHVRQRRPLLRDVSFTNVTHSDQQLRGLCSDPPSFLPPSLPRCPPRTFLPALCKIFLDESAPDNVLEVTARAITYYLDVSAECTRRIVGVDGAIKALCNRLVVVELNNRTSRDLAEQCVKVRDEDELTAFRVSI